MTFIPILLLDLIFPYLVQSNSESIYKWGTFSYLSHLWSGVLLLSPPLPSLLFPEPANI